VLVFKYETTIYVLALVLCGKSGTELFWIVPAGSLRSIVIVLY
jgi:hypothetical protein